MAAMSTMFAQNIVTGVVRDSDGELPLPSANVFLEGTMTGTITNLNGEFRFPLNAGSYTVVVSYMGYEEDETRGDPERW